MKVAVLHNLGPGGAHRRLREQTAQLHALGVEVCEITTSAAEPVTMRPVVVPLRWAGDHVPRLLRPPLRRHDMVRLGRTWREMGRVAEACGADVVYANPDRLLKGAVPSGSRLPVARFVDEPRRIDHEPELEATLNPSTRRLYAGLRRRQAAVDRAAVGEAATVLTNSAYTAGRIAEAYGRPALPISCGVPDDLRPDGPAAPPHLLSVGALIPTKGHALAIEAAARSGLGLPVVVVSHTGEPEEERRLHAVAREHGAELSIRVGVSDAQLAEHYRGAAALLYLSEREPLGLVSLEAQVCGCPVIVADEGGLPETVRPGGGVTVPRDAAAAAEAIRRVVAAPRPRPAAIPSWRDCAEELRDVLARAAAGDVVVPGVPPVTIPGQQSRPVTLPAEGHPAPVQGS